MKLLGQQLSQAGLTFMSAKALHKKGGIRIDSIVCETQAEAAAIDSWAADRGYPVIARVATPEEVAEYRKWQQ
jgi:hypothetical protein